MAIRNSTTKRPRRIRIEDLSNTEPRVVYTSPEGRIEVVRYDYADFGLFCDGQLAGASYKTQSSAELAGAQWLFDQAELVIVDAAITADNAAEAIDADLAAIADEVGCTPAQVAGVIAFAHANPIATAEHGTVTTTYVTAKHCAICGKNTWHDNGVCIEVHPVIEDITVEDLDFALYAIDLEWQDWATVRVIESAATQQRITQLCDEFGVRDPYARRDLMAAARRDAHSWICSECGGKGCPVCQPDSPPEKPYPLPPQRMTAGRSDYAMVAA